MKRVFLALIRNWWAIYITLVVTLLVVFVFFRALVSESAEDVAFHPASPIVQILIGTILIFPWLIFIALIFQYIYQRRLLYNLLLMAVSAAGWSVGMTILVSPSYYFRFTQIAEAQADSHTYYLTRYSNPERLLGDTLFIHECNWLGTDCSPIFRAGLNDPDYFDSVDQVDTELKIENGTLLILVRGNVRARVDLDK